MLIEIPTILVEEALSAHFIQQGGSLNTMELRCRDVERREHHFAELVMAIIVQEYRKMKLLPYDNKPR